MAENPRLCKRKRKHLSDVELEAPTLLQAASDLCNIFALNVNGINSDDGLCADYSHVEL